MAFGLLAVDSEDILQQGSRFLVFELELLEDFLGLLYLFFGRFDNFYACLKDDSIFKVSDGPLNCFIISQFDKRISTIE